MTQLTPQLLAMYLGCRMQYATHHEPQNETYVLSLDNIAEAYKFGDKPVLRRLEDMTEEDAKGMIQANGEGWAVEELSIFHTSDSLPHINYKLIDMAMPQVRNLSIFSEKEFRWLLREGIDLFGLIDSGLAIDSKALQP